MEHIDGIVYINLEHRTDRRTHIEAEISKLCTDQSKIVRINAVKFSIGIIGCGMSHILALEEFARHPEWNTCLILEDDFTLFNSSLEYNNNRIQHCFSAFPKWDMIVLSHNPNPGIFKNSPTGTEGIVKVINTYTASAYIVNRNFLDKILSNFKEGLELKLGSPKTAEYCVDVYWNRLHSVANWYALVPALGYQCEGHSDIEGKNVNYRC